MRKPKIGDIVLYHGQEGNCPSIIFDFVVEKDSYKLVLFGVETSTYYTFAKRKDWSWPEETGCKDQKPQECEHKHFYYKWCSKCGERVEMNNI